jgi:hypothetical protein
MRFNENALSVSLVLTLTLLVWGAGFAVPSYSATNPALVKQRPSHRCFARYWPGSFSPCETPRIRTLVRYLNLIVGAGDGIRTRDLNFGKVVVAGEGIYPFLRDLGLLMLRENGRGSNALSRGL